MKIKFTKLLALTISIVLLTCFVACNNGGETKVKLVSSTDTQIVMQVEETDGNANALNALKSIRNQDLISFDYLDSTYGAYITSISGKAEQIIESTLTSSKGYSWALYTSDIDNAYLEETITVDGVVCGKAAMGASSLIVKKDALYVWVYEYYEYSW